VTYSADARLENTDHPVVYEFINSLEFLKNDVAGLMTRRDFKRFFKKLVEEGRKDFCVVVYMIENYNEIIEKVGHITPYNIISELVSLCKDSCGDLILGIGSYGLDKIVSVVNVREPEVLRKYLTLIAKKLQDKDFLQEQAYTNVCVEFSIYAGYTRYVPGKSLNELVDEAIKQRLLIGKLLCGKKQQR
jgi:GGDEF domain-containing protein